MSYALDDFAQTLRQARLQKGWSQRELSQKVGIPQAHSSKIESGGVDVRISTFVELARLLDLELVLAPRTSLPALQALIREVEANNDTRTARGVANRLTSLALRLRKAKPDNDAVERLATLASEITQIAPLFQSPGALIELQDVVRELDTAAETPEAIPVRLDRAVRRLADLRNRLVHARPVTQAPAYSLDEED